MEKKNIKKMLQKKCAKKCGKKNVQKKISKKKIVWNFFQENCANFFAKKKSPNLTPNNFLANLVIFFLYEMSQI